MLAQAVQELLDRRNLTPHGAHLRYGISREAVAKLLSGHAPSLEVVEKWARAMGEDENHWRELAGYPRADTRCQAALSGVEALIGGLLALQDEFGRPVPIPRACGHVRTLTTDEAEDILSVIRRELKENRY